MSFFRSFGVFAFAVLFSLSALAADVVLVKDGRALATIVTAPKPPRRISQAAADLQRYVKEICGVELPIRNDGKRVPGTGLYIGVCEASLPDDVPAEDVNPEAYAIRVRDGNLFFAGQNPTPAAFAVVSFIEDVLGVRWFAPGDLWEDVPKGTPGNLTVSVEDTPFVIPGTSPRVWSGHNWHETWDDWNLRNKTLVCEVVPLRQFQNRIHTIFPVEKYAETHPEYYPLFKGKRWIPPKGNRYWRPCESNPEVQRIIVEHIRKYFDGHPKVDSFSLGMDDISHLCSCEHCRALDTHPDSSYEKREFSDRHYKVVNQIAREVAKTHPDRYIGTLIYNIARALPEQVPVLEPNVFGYITETSALWWREGLQQEDHELTKAWRKRCQHLCRYDYYGMGTMTPRYTPHAVDEQMKFDKSLGLRGMYIEVYTFLPHTAPMIWLTAKLQWDHRLDADVLLNEFMEKMYGSAAPVMKQYWDLLEKSWNTSRPNRKGWVHRRIVNQALAMAPTDVDRAFELLDAALAASETDKQRRRIGIHRAALKFSSYAIYAYGLSQQLGALEVRDAASADLAMSLLERQARLSAEREPFFAEVVKREDLLGRNVRGLTEKKNYMPIGKFPELEKESFDGLAKLLSWSAKNDPQRLPAIAAKVGSMGGSLGKLAAAWTYCLNHKLDNLVKNGDFEIAGTNTATPDRSDWSTKGAPKHWNSWSSFQTAKFGTRREEESTVGFIEVQRGSATYLQSVAVKPGECYIFTGRVKQLAGTSEAKGTAHLAFRLRTPKGKWYPDRNREASVKLKKADSQWHSLVLFIEIPEGAGTLILMPGASGWSAETGGTACYDDLELYRLPAGFLQKK